MSGLIVWIMSVVWMFGVSYRFLGRLCMISLIIFLFLMISFLKILFLLIFWIGRGSFFLMFYRGICFL